MRHLAARPRAKAAAFLGCLLVAAAGITCRGSAGSGFAGVRNLDVVLVTIDTLRADAPGYAGNRRVATPALDRVAREGVDFADTHGQNVITLPSHVNILTGLYPYQHGVRDNDGFRLSDKVPTLATLLHSAGYATGAFIGAFPLDSRYGLARGFDVYDQHYPEGAHAYDFVMPERPASEVVAAARQWLGSERARPHFLWVHLYDCHAPYLPPPPFDREYADNPYLGEVAGVDAALAPLFEDLRGLAGPVLLVVTGDHGESLGSHGEETHGLFAYEATLHVPLLIWSPGRLAPRRDPGLARHIDIAPTILDAAGVPAPKEMHGGSLLGSHRVIPEASYFEALTTSLNRGWAPLKGALGGGFKYIELPIPELYDLARDPGEMENLASRRADLVRRLKAAIPEEAGPVAGAVPSEEAAKLRSLGYLSGSGSPKARYGPEDDPKKLVALDGQLHHLVDLYQRGKLREAMTLARGVVAERPSMQTGYEFLSFLQGQAGDDAGAIETLRGAGRRGLLNEPLAARLALFLASAGRSNEALTVLGPYSSSGDPETLNALGIARAGAGELGPALEAFRAALRSDPRNASAFQNIGIALLQNGRVAEAIESFQKAFALNDRLPRAWNAYGVALQQSGKPKPAIDAWKRAVVLDPGQFDALFNIAVISAKVGDVPSERTALEDFVARAPASRYGKDIARASARLAEIGGRSSSKR